MNKLTKYLVEPFLLDEGVNDPGILKAVFLAGGPGSGKSYVAGGIFGIPSKVNTSAYGLKLVNQDKELERMLKKYGFGTDLDNMPDELFRQLTDPNYSDYSGFRSRAKELTASRKKLYMDGRLGMIIDGTGHKYNKIREQKMELEEIGYDCYMVFVHTDLDIAQQRNMERPRKLSPELVERSWKDVQKNKEAFQGLFGNMNFIMVNNNDFLSEKAATQKFNMLVKKGIGSFIKKPVRNYRGKKWIDKQKILKEKIKIDVSVGDTILTGRFKNKKVKVKNIGRDKYGMPTINGKKVVTFRKGADRDFLKSIEEEPRVPRKKGQHRGSKSHSDLYTDENPKGTIKGLKFATVKDAKASVSKIRGSGKSHAHKIQAAVAMEQRAKEMGKTSQAAVYRAYINKMKKKTKKKNETSVPSPSRKMVNKMKKRGNTSVPYGSGYKKVNEQKQIKKTIGVFGGRFQPFHSGHLATYKWLSKQVDEAYITTSNIKQPPRHPMNFKEKVRHMVKMGIPKNRIVQETTPYVAKNLLKKFNPDTTAVVYAFGTKDAGRLKAGRKKTGEKTYYQDYKTSKGDIKGFEEHGYFVTAPQFGKVSGTQMRQLLGSPKVDDNEREKSFKKSFGYFDKGIYNMMTNKFKKLFENFKLSTQLIKEFLQDVDINYILKENSTNVRVGSDDGPGTFYQDFSDYYRVAKGDLPNFMNQSGWGVVDYLINDERSKVLDPSLDYSMIYNPIGQVTFGRAGSIPGAEDSQTKYEERINSIVGRLGYEVVKWMGLDGKGLEIAQKPSDEYGKGKIAWSAKGTKDVEGELPKREKFDFSPNIKERINLQKEVQLLIEGGAYGHLNHPFDDKNLTFSDFKTLIINTLQGNLDSEGAVTEKTDGQNIMISWKNDKLIAARNKGHIKNHGANALSISGVKNMFAGRGEIEKAFVSAMQDLQKAIKGLSKKQKDKIFDEGKKFMSLEVIYPKTANVIPYDKSLLQFHGTIEYDSAGSPIGEDRGSARMLAGMIKQINQDIQKTYSITKPFVTNLPKVKDFSRRQSYFLGKLNKLKNEYKLKDTDTLTDYHQAYWMEYIFNAGKQFKYHVPNKILVKLVRRWAFFDKSYKVPQIRKDLKDYPKFLDWVLTTDKIDHAKLQKKHIRDWEVLFFELGAEILSNLSDFIAANPNKAAQQIRKDLQKAINQVKTSKNPKVLNTLKTQLDRLNAIGGLKSVVPSEGITFVFKGKLYKYTGAFAPANQILGMLKFV